MHFVQVDLQQVRGLVRERNHYFRLLQESLHVLDELPNRRIPRLKAGSTYQLAAEIEKTIKHFTG